MSTLIDILNFLRDRSRIKVEARAGWRVSVGGPYDPNKDYLIISVINKGRRPVTITKAWVEMRTQEPRYRVAADSGIWGHQELGEGKRVDYLLDQAELDISDIKYAYAEDATGKTYRGKLTE